MIPHEIEVRFCERGVGETMSSGTGSCAAAVAAIHSRQSAIARAGACAPEARRPWNGIGEVFLTGPATLLCRGEFFV